MQTKVIALIVNINRLPNSEFGNPRFEVISDNDQGLDILRTKPNALCAYKITGNERGTYELTLDGRFRIIDLEKIS